MARGCIAALLGGSSASLKNDGVPPAQPTRRAAGRPHPTGRSEARGWCRSGCWP